LQARMIRSPSNYVRNTDPYKQPKIKATQNGTTTGKSVDDSMYVVRDAKGSEKHNKI